MEQTRSWLGPHHTQHTPLLSGLVAPRLGELSIMLVTDKLRRLVGGGHMYGGWGRKYV